jgi:LPXTG-motif cell wall-anchored protein
VPLQVYLASPTQGQHNSGSSAWIWFVVIGLAVVVIAVVSFLRRGSR